MASNDRQNRIDARKKSSLDPDRRTMASSGAASNKNATEKEKDGRGGITVRQGAPGLALLVDLILIVLLIALAAGIWFGYRAIRSAYSRDWEARPITYTLMIKDIDRDLAADLLDGISVGGVWYTDDTEGDRIGTVSEVRMEPAVDAVFPSSVPPSETVTLYVTVKADAMYREGEGYFVGSTRLLAGETGIYRLNGLVSEGTIISLAETVLPETGALADTGIESIVESAAMTDTVTEEE